MQACNPNTLQNFHAFQLVCLTVAGTATFFLYLAGRLGKRALGQKSHPLLPSDTTSSPNDPSQTSWSSLIVLTKELMLAGDFLRVVLTNFLHSCRGVAQLNFASIAVDILVPQTVMGKGSWQMSGFFAVCTLLPQVLMILSERLLLRHGAHRTMMASCVLSAASASLYFLPYSPYLVMTFMLMDRLVGGGGEGELNQ